MEASEEIFKGISEAIRGLDLSQVERMLEALLNVRAEGSARTFVRKRESKYFSNFSGL